MHGEKGFRFKNVNTLQGTMAERRRPNFVGKFWQIEIRDAIAYMLLITILSDDGHGLGNCKTGLLYRDRL